MKTKSPSSARPILRWPGSKNRMLKHLLPMVTPHVCYAEPFAGSLALLMAKERSKVEVVNDVNKNLVALYRSIQFHLPEVYRQLEYLFASRDMLHDFIDQPGLTEIQRAMGFLLVNRTSFGGNMHSFGVCKTAGGGVGLDRAKVSELLGRAHERLNGVIVENLPYERILKNQDSKDTLFFLDPPYLHHKCDAYAAWTEKDMRKLKRNLGKLQGRWILTLDDSPFNRELFRDCKLQHTVSQNRAVNCRTHGETTFGELIITPN